jgi:hypothetical protein
MLPETFDYYPPEMYCDGTQYFGYDYLSYNTSFIRRSANRYCEVELNGFCPLSFWEVRIDNDLSQIHWDKLCAAQITIKRELSEEDIERAMMVRKTNPSFFLKAQMTFEEWTAHYAISFRDKFLKKDEGSGLWYECSGTEEGAVYSEEFWNRMLDINDRMLGISDLA